MSEEYLSWNSTIDDGTEYVLFDDGTYDFKVLDFVRSRSLRDSNLLIAEIKLEVTDGYRSKTITERFALKESVKWKIAQFFRSIGMKKHGQDFVMNWESSVGRDGLCKLKQEKYVDGKGIERTSNKVEEFLDNIETEVNGSGDPPWLIN